jgi:predicted lactoylglutathione lyase
VDLGRFRVGLRVDDVIRAAEFYRGMGFTDVGSVPGPDGVPVMVMLQREGVMLIVDALGYLWEISQPISDMQTDEAVAAAHDSWYGA